MDERAAVKGAFMFYNMAWGMAGPLLSLNPRLREGMGRRMLKRIPPPCDIWIQAASAGESYLALEILKHLLPRGQTRVLVTTNTSQGLNILERGAGNRPQLHISYFPFDRPKLMDKAVRLIRPKVMVLLETEIWPGLLRALKKRGAKIVILNGRLSPGSLKGYLLWKNFWTGLCPDKILAVSREDKERYSQLFEKSDARVMPNMKFDRFAPAHMPGHDSAFLKNRLGNSPFVLLGSVRRQEEEQVGKIIAHLFSKRPDILVGLFPRHMHRIEAWKDILNGLGVPWILRSQMKGSPSGRVILWDVFGELTMAYSLAGAAFVGGSLVPLGGQNFLEALAFGVVPIMGPHWDDFLWVGQEIKDCGLLRTEDSWQGVAKAIMADLEKPAPRDEVIKKAKGYMRERSGGALVAVQAIKEALEGL